MKNLFESFALANDKMFENSLHRSLKTLSDYKQKCVRRQRCRLLNKPLSELPSTKQGFK